MKFRRKYYVRIGSTERRNKLGSTDFGICSNIRWILKALSFDGIEVEAARHLASLKAIDPMKIFHKTIDYKIYNGDYEVPVRIYLPREKVTEDLPVFLFFHGGGWVTDCIDNYERICVQDWHPRQNILWCR